MSNRPLAIVLPLLSVLILAGCVVVDPDPDSTPLTGPGVPGGDDVIDDGGGDPFAPPPPTTVDGWTARYRDAPWLSDDLDNADFFITGAVDGHEVLGIYCSGDGNPGQSFASSASDTAVEVWFPSGPGSIAVDVYRSEYLTYTGIGTFAVPPDEPGTQPISVSFATSMQIDNSPGVYGKASPSTADVRLEFLAVPFPDPETCKTERSDLKDWITEHTGR